ncbi:multiple sugar transport system permease protein [Amycolatopsis bartoniae]|uniref:Sugar ABC transporter permease n=1 Tax=Amycolatopsis bartoniae TaxID=941986 RepID=A0A8H9M8B0_9PSEU|nr:carbohydrate ABC transporter permease [Amycolatopsis bartoniae]MBB2939617.1 multiple sugar transport system permease protein [Amycolatopsis bartoniae]TVT07823.1 carbohydrate ABC transporter permease [Amycolatopsis bartoniae]GHF39652.1 sugar ABC transporter permease [Amycolatopsis bartoniae]
MNRTKPLLWHVLMVLILVVLLYPVIWLVSTSFKPAEEVVSTLALLPSHPTGGNYAEVFNGVAGYGVWHYFGNSLLVSGGAVLGNVVSCALAGYAFGRLHFRGRGPLFAFMISTIMLPQHVVLIPQYVIFQQLGMVNTFWPLVLPKFLATDAFFVFLMVQFVRTLPRELDEAATIDGCGPLRTFRYVIAPLLRPAMITTAIFTFIWTWNDFFTQLIYLNDPSTFTLPLALQTFVDQTTQSAFGPMFAMSVLALVPIGLFFLAFQRFLVDGAATTGLRG